MNYKYVYTNWNQTVNYLKDDADDTFFYLKHRATPHDKILRKLSGLDKKSIKYFIDFKNKSHWK